MRSLVAAALCVAGLITLMVGTFLPWLRSGRGSHNSYETDGTIQRLLDVHGPAGSALSAWPFVGVACAAAVALLVLGLVRWGAALALVVALAAGAVAVGTLAVRGSALVEPAGLGPAVTLVGAIVALIPATLCLFERPTADSAWRRRS